MQSLYRSLYRHTEDIDIPDQEQYVKGQKVRVTESKKEIKEEFNCDPDQKLKIKQAQKYCGKEGIIEQKDQFTIGKYAKIIFDLNILLQEANFLKNSSITEYAGQIGIILKLSKDGLKKVYFVNGEAYWFTKQCLQLHEQFGFHSVEKAIEGDYWKERNQLLIEATTNTAILECKNLDCCGLVIYIRLWDQEHIVRQKWDVLLTILHELAHNHPRVKEYGGANGHGFFWKRFYRDLFKYFLSCNHELTQQEVQYMKLEIEDDIKKH